MAYRDYFVFLKKSLSYLDDETLYSCSLHVENYLINHSFLHCGFSTSYKARSFIRNFCGTSHLVKFRDSYYILPRADFEVFVSLFDLLISFKGIYTFSSFCDNFDDCDSQLRELLFPSPCADVVNESCNLSF